LTVARVQFFEASALKYEAPNRAPSALALAAEIPDQPKSTP
jgi:hypothetical protein